MYLIKIYFGKFLKILLKTFGSKNTKKKTTSLVFLMKMDVMDLREVP